MATERSNRNGSDGGEATIDERIAKLVRAAVRDELAPLLDEQGERPDPAKLLTKADLAQRLQVSTRTIDTLRAKGLPTTWVVESPRFDWPIVRTWLAEQPDPKVRRQ
jgi:hypothetical protein